ncbi:MAG: ABC transporter ATP-binding protein/permease [Anaerolineales bacterium]|nr:ABC transporter ATP-binding protein/permease [Anaerolineales bacterium]
MTSSESFSNKPFLEALGLTVYSGWASWIRFHINKLIHRLVVLKYWLSFRITRLSVWIGFIPLRLWSLVSGNSREEVATKMKQAMPEFQSRPWFKREKLLDGVSIKIHAGELIFLMGPSGAGKSTLLRLLSGQATSRWGGKIRVHGLEKEIAEIPGKLIGYLAQDDILHDELSIRQSLRLAAKIRYPLDNKVNENVKEVIEQTGIAHRQHHSINALSGGERRRANLAAELLGKPMFLFLDEPTANLDPYHSKELIRLIKSQVVDVEHSVIISTHDVWNKELHNENDAADEGVTIKVAFLVEGKLVYFGSPREAICFFSKSMVTQNLFAGMDSEQTQVKELSDIYDIFQSIKDDKQRFEIASQYATEWRNSYSIDEEEMVMELDDHEERRLWQLWASSLGSRFRQFLALLRRFMSCYLTGMSLVLLLQPIIGAILVALLIQGNSLTETFGEAQGAGFTMVILAAIMGLVNSHREIAKERAIYHQERMVGLHPMSYYLSKVFFLYVVSTIQICIMLFIIGIKIDFPTGLVLLSPLDIFVSLLSCTIANVNIGLFISSIVKKAGQATNLLVPILALELTLAGVLFDLSGGLKLIAQSIPSYWSYQAIATSLNFNSITVLNQNESFSYTIANLIDKWIWLLILSLSFSLVTILILVIDRKRSEPRHIKVLIKRVRGLSWR